MDEVEVLHRDYRNGNMRRDPGKCSDQLVRDAREFTTGVHPGERPVIVAEDSPDLHRLTGGLVRLNNLSQLGVVLGRNFTPRRNSTIIGGSVRNDGAVNLHVFFRTLVGRMNTILRDFIGARYPLGSPPSLSTQTFCRDPPLLFSDATSSVSTSLASPKTIMVFGR